MHPDFPKWYREVSIEENRDRIGRRWTGVASIVKDIDFKGVEAALQVIYRAKTPPTVESLGKLRQAFKTADELFDMQGNDREMEILCGAVLAALLATNSSVVASASLAVTTSSLDGTRVAELPMDILALAETAIARIGEAQRQRPTRPKLTFKTAKDSIATLDAATVSAAFGAIAEEINSALGKSDKYIAIQDEELEMLWWVLNERSEDLGKAFKDLPLKAQPLILANELARATEFLPGPRSAKGLLGRAGLKESKKGGIADAVNECDLDWLKSLAMPDSLSPLIHPIHSAIARRIETGDTTSWVAGWATTSGLNEKQSLTSLTLGDLFYRERLLALFEED